jgi:hypothetical protein
MEKYCLTQDVELDHLGVPRKTADGAPIYTAPNLFRSDMCKEWMRNRLQSTGTNTFEKVCANGTNKVFLDKAKTKVGYAIDLPECSCISARDALAKSNRLNTVAPECILSKCLAQKGQGFATWNQQQNTCQMTYCEMNFKDVEITAGDEVSANFKQQCGSTSQPPSDPNVKPPESDVETVESPRPFATEASRAVLIVSIVGGAIVLVIMIALIIKFMRRPKSVAFQFGKRNLRTAPYGNVRPRVFHSSRL